MDKNSTVLVVDDEPRNLRIAQEILDDLVNVKLVHNGEEALKELESCQPDLVLLDVMMPGVDGYEICRQIRAKSGLELTKVIMLSGKAMMSEKLKGYEAGADDYLTKPFVAEELLAKTKVFLRLVRTEKALVELNKNLDEKVIEGTRRLMEAEVKLIHAAKLSALGDMAGGIAHEINTPLSIIAMLSEQIVESISEESVDRALLADLCQNIDSTVVRISTIVRGLRTIARDGSREDFELVSVRQIVEDALLLCHEKTKHSGIDVRLKDIPSDLRICCQKTQISQVILNLIGNSCDAIADKGDKWIELSAEKQESGVSIYITDSGTGIPEQIRHRLFQPFFTTKEVGKATGLGLCISKGIIEAHGGVLSLDSTCSNTRFEFMIPDRLSGSTLQSWKGPL